MRHGANVHLRTGARTLLFFSCIPAVQTRICARHARNTAVDKIKVIHISTHNVWKTDDFYPQHVEKPVHNLWTQWDNPIEELHPPKTWYSHFATTISDELPRFHCSSSVNNAQGRPQQAIFQTSTASLHSFQNNYAQLFKKRRNSLQIARYSVRPHIRTRAQADDVSTKGTTINAHQTHRKTHRDHPSDVYPTPRSPPLHLRPRTCDLR